MGPETTTHRFLCEESSGLASVYRDVEGTGVTNCNAAEGHGGYAAMIDYVWYEFASLSVKQRLCLPNLTAMLRKRGLSEDGPAKPTAPTLLSVEFITECTWMVADWSSRGQTIDKLLWM